MKKQVETLEVVLRIDADGILENLRLIQQRTKAQIMAVVKNNGYGLGLCEYAGMLSAMGIGRFAVGNVQEALELRKAGTSGEILVLEPVYGQEALMELSRLNVSLQLSSLQQLDAIKRAMQGLHDKPRMHLKLDTGLGRWGFRLDELPNALDSLKKWRFAGCYSHLAAPYGAASTSLQQARQYTKCLEMLDDAGIETGSWHLCASGGTLRFPELHMDMVRVGSALVGGVPNAQSYGLKPVARLEAPIAMIKSVKKGESLGYGAEAVLKKNSRIAVVAAGKHEGLKQTRYGGRLGSLIERFRPSKPLLAKINEENAPVVGSLGANHLMLDVSEISCKIGDHVFFSINPIYCPEAVRREWREG